MAVAVLEAGSDKSDAVGRFWRGMVRSGLMQSGRAVMVGSSMAGTGRLRYVWHGGIGETRIDKQGLGGLGAARLGAVDLILLWRLWIGAERIGKMGLGG